MEDLEIDDILENDLSRVLGNGSRPLVCNILVTGTGFGRNLNCWEISFYSCISLEAISYLEVVMTSNLEI